MDHHKPSGVFVRSPAEIEQRKQCIVATRTYYHILDLANQALAETDKIIDKPEVIEQHQRKIYLALLEDIEKCIAAADWSISLFFQGIGKRMTDVRDKLREGLQLHAEEGSNHLIKANVKEGMKKVYVLLYQAEGNNMRKWAAVLSSLTRMSIGRPIYADESAAIAAIRAKTDTLREGYVAVWVHKDDIIAPFAGIQPQDRLGNPLLTIREGTIQPHHIIEFIHINERKVQHYLFEKGTLIPKEE